MTWIASQKFARPVVHIIDREAASVQHQRQWDEAKHLFVLRDKVGSKVEFNGREVKLGEVAESLTFQIIHETECWLNRDISTFDCRSDKAQAVIRH